MVREIISLLAGILLGMCFPLLESLLIKEFDEIKEEKHWPFWVMPIISGILALLVGRQARTYGEALVAVLLVCLLLLLACFDLKYMLLPTKAILPGIGLILGWQLFQWSIAKENGQLLNSLLGGLIGFGVFWLIFYGSKWVLKKEGLGYGDVRLMALVGLILGLDKVFLAIIIASVLAVVVGIVQLGRKKQSEAFPFGPYLCLGTILLMIWEEQIMTLYLRCLGL